MKDFHFGCSEVEWEESMIMEEDLGKGMVVRKKKRRCKGCGVEEVKDSGGEWRRIKRKVEGGGE